MPPVVFSLWIQVVFPSRPFVVATVCRSSQAMFPEPPGALCVRAASTELLLLNCHTGSPVAKFRKCVPTGFGEPVVL
jgi:hypothetical protein